MELAIRTRRLSKKFRRHLALSGLQRLVGYLPGDFAPYPDLTAAHCLRYFANLRGGVEPAAVAALAEHVTFPPPKQ